MHEMLKCVHEQHGVKLCENVVTWDVSAMSSTLRYSEPSERNIDVVSMCRHTYFWKSQDLYDFAC